MTTQALDAAQRSLAVSLLRHAPPKDADAALLEMREQARRIVSDLEPADWRLAQAHAEQLTGSRQLRVEPVVNGLLKRKTITPSQHNAAQRLYRDWAFGIEGAREGGTMVKVSGGGAISMSDAQLMAASNFRGAVECMKRLSAYVLPVALYDRSINDVSKIHRVNKHSAAELVRVGLDTAADYYMNTGDGGMA